MKKITEYITERGAAPLESYRVSFIANNKNIDATILSTEVAGGFVGTVVGMFATSGGDYKESKFFVDFDWFRYENSGREWIC